MAKYVKLDDVMDTLLHEQYGYLCEEAIKAIPAIEIPKHADLIDADKLIELCDIMANQCDGMGVSIWHQFKTMVEWSPIVVPAEE